MQLFFSAQWLSNSLKEKNESSPYALTGITEIYFTSQALKIWYVKF